MDKGLIHRGTTAFWVLLVGLCCVGCGGKKEEQRCFSFNDGVEYWNYEWKRNYPYDYGKTFAFYKNGDFLDYLYIKQNGVRQIYREDVEQP